MCQPTTASTSPAAVSAPTSSATAAGLFEPSITLSSSSRPSTPSPPLISATASRAQSSHEGPKIPAEPCSGTTSATLTADSIGAGVSLPRVASGEAGTAQTGEALVLAIGDAERRLTRRLAQVLAHHDCTVER